LSLKVFRAGRFAEIADRPAGKTMYELVEKILYAVTFIAVGGTLALVFFFVQAG